MDLANQSAARIVLQNCKSAATCRLAEWLPELRRDCATASVQCGMGPGVLLVVVPSLPAHGTQPLCPWGKAEPKRSGSGYPITDRQNSSFYILYQGTSTVLLLPPRVVATSVGFKPKGVLQFYL